ncbi:hypothetical protein [Breoghania sp. L-A4]|uniref:hypothetical protein n=1 Tax=Breoghania sp. L-A4 TaxID=2304600 RepID=UPI0020C012AE|nr:hypothetical protein [Breoghania sp. L-A4]
MDTTRAHGRGSGRRRPGDCRLQLGWLDDQQFRERAFQRFLRSRGCRCLDPYCIRSSTTDPKAAEVLAELKAASSYQRRGIVEKAGWATPLGAERPNRDLAQACQIALSKDT